MEDNIKYEKMHSITVDADTMSNSELYSKIKSLNSVPANDMSLKSFKQTDKCWKIQLVNRSDENLVNNYQFTELPPKALELFHEFCEEFRYLEGFQDLHLNGYTITTKKEGLYIRFEGRYQFGKWLGDVKLDSSRFERMDAFEGSLGSHYKTLNRMIELYEDLEEYVILNLAYFSGVVKQPDLFD